MSLTDTQVRNTKPAAKPFKLSDGGGLYLLVSPNGTKAWRLAYRYHGKQKALGFGLYPSITLADARASREQAKSLLARGSALKKKREIDGSCHEGQIPPETDQQR
jgi:hypothetical protein